MKMNGIYVWAMAAMGAVGLGLAVSACSDSVASPAGDNNLLNNPSAAKIANAPMRNVVAPRTISQDAVPVREIYNNNLNDGQNPTDTVAPPVNDSVQFHEKKPTYSRLFNMKHDGRITVYTDAGGTQWFHVGAGAWQSYYSPNPGAIGPGDVFHEGGGANATQNVPMWHITHGPYQSKYFDPTGGGSVWEHDGRTTSYIPVQGTHIPTGPTTTFYQVAPVDTNAIPDDLKSKLR